MRALCDLGSQINLISGYAAQLLKITKIATHAQIVSLSGDVVAARGIAWLEIASNVDARVKEIIGAYVVPTMLGNLPKAPIDVSEWNHIRDLQLADKSSTFPTV